jgi:ankyrin repeat protein
MLLERVTDVDKAGGDGYTALQLAVEGQNNAAVDILLENGACYQPTMQHSAAYNKDVTMIKLLFEKCGDIGVNAKDSHGYTALYMAT